MAEMIISALFFVFIVVAMAIGVLMGHKPIQGSCGGMSALGMDTGCEICGGDPKLCDAEMDTTEPASNLAYDAATRITNS